MGCVVRHTKMLRRSPHDEAVATQSGRAKTEPPDWQEDRGTRLACAGIRVLPHLSFGESVKTLTSITVRESSGSAALLI